MKTKLFLLALLLTIPGCSKKENSQRTPEGTVRIFAENLTQMNKEGYMAVVSGGPVEKEVLGNIFEVVGTMDQFQKDIIAEYGEKAGADFRKNGIMTSQMNLSDLNKKIDQMKVDIKGDKATCTFPDDKQPMILVKKDGLWYIDGSAMNAGGDNEADLKKMGQMWSQVNSSVQELRKKIGQEDVTVESLKEELGMTVLTALLSTMPPEMKMNMKAKVIDKMKEKMNEQKAAPGEMPKIDIKAPGQ